MLCLPHTREAISPCHHTVKKSTGSQDWSRCYSSDQFSALYMANWQGTTKLTALSSALSGDKGLPLTLTHWKPLRPEAHEMMGLAEWPLRAPKGDGHRIMRCYSFPPRNFAIYFLRIKCSQRSNRQVNTVWMKGSIV